MDFRSFKVPYPVDDRKKWMKRRAFEIVADQTGKIFDPNVFTIVWARRFAGYKRASLIASDKVRFEKLLSNTKYPVQIIWGGIIVYRPNSANSVHL